MGKKKEKQKKKKSSSNGGKQSAAASTSHEYDPPPPPPGAPLRCLNPESGPWLFYQHGKGHKTHTFVGMSDGSCEIRSIRELRRKTLLASPGGWILAWDETTRRCSLVNPTSTSTGHELPDMPSGVDCINFVTSSSPAQAVAAAVDDPKSCRVVVAINSPYAGLLSCHVVGDSQWAHHRGGHSENGIPNEIISVRGRLFLCGRSSGVWGVDLDSPAVFTKLIHGWTDDRWALMSTHYGQVVESEGELFTVHSNQNRLTTTHLFFIYKLDWERKVWTEVGDIGQRVFFVGSDCGLSCSVGLNSGLRNNCIYFVLESDMKLYCYNMEDGSTSVALPFLGIRKPFTTPLWINRPI